MGDFNMSLLQVIPALRSRGLTADLGAWLPWKSLAGTPMSDSCGVFFVNMPGEYVLYKGLENLHHNDHDGIFEARRPRSCGRALGAGARLRAVRS